MNIFYTLGFSVVCFFLVFLLLMWFKWVDMQKSKLDRETVSSFECGFDSKDASRLPFSLRFFLMVMLFIIFDVEICVLLQLPFEFMPGCFENRLWYFVFILLMSLGVIEEIRRGILNWKV